MSENLDIKEFIRTRLDNFDKSNEKYNYLLEADNIKINKKDNLLYLLFSDKNDKKIYEGQTTVLGSLDLDTNIWLWAWVTPYVSSEESKDSRDLLKYGLELEPDNNSNIHFYIKSHFVNSRIHFDSDVTFDIHLALSLYITKKPKFIYPREVNLEGGKTIVVYYLVY
jgi:hypothetical protein